LFNIEPHEYATYNAPDDLARIGVNIKEIMNEKLLGNVEQ